MIVHKTLNGFMYQRMFYPDCLHFEGLLRKNFELEETVAVLRLWRFPGIRQRFPQPERFPFLSNRRIPNDSSQASDPRRKLPSFPKVPKRKFASEGSQAEVPKRKIPPKVPKRSIPSDSFKARDPSESSQARNAKRKLPGRSFLAQFSKRKIHRSSPNQT